MNIAELSIRRPVFIACLFVAILALGILARARLGTALYPDVSFPIVNVIVPFPGAGSDEIEAQIARPVETALNSLQGIRQVRSLSLDGAAVMTAVFSMDTDIRFDEQKVIQSMARVRSELPSGALEPAIRSIDPSDTPVVTLSLAADLPEGRLFDLANDEVRPLLEQVPQVGQIEVQGARRREIEVELDIDKLKAKEMSAAEVVGRLGAAGMNIPAGQIDDPKRETYVRTVGEFDSLDAVRRTPIRFVGNEAVTTLSEVATVADGLEDERNRVYVDGARALTLRVYRRAGGNTVAVSDGVRERVREIRRELGPKIKGFRIAVLRDGAKAVRDGVDDATGAILLGVALTVGVVLLFLGSLRSTIITGLALPNSLLGAFALMWVAGFTVNITTLAALALAVGLLIDDAIVVRENIFRRIEGGEPPALAAVNGTREVTLAVIATTLTVLSVFGPVSFLGGVIGQFFREFGLTICFAMLISLFDSLTIAPMLSAYFAGKQGGHGAGGFPSRAVSRTFGAMLRPFSRLRGAGARLQQAQERLYIRVLERTLRHPSRVLLLALGICGLSLLALMHIPKSFVPSQESGEFQVSFGLPAGVSLDATDDVGRQADRLIRSHPEVQRTVLTAGGPIGETNVGGIIVLLKPARERSRSTNEVKERVRQDLKTLPQASWSVEDLMDIGGGAGRPFVVHITGRDMAGIQAVAAQLVERLKRSPNLRDPQSSYRPGAAELRWVIDPTLADEYGISSAEVGRELRILIAGATPARYHEGGREYEVRARLRPDQRDLRETFPRVVVPNLNHRLIPLSLVARRVEASTPAKIERQDRKRFVEVSADLNPGGRGLAAALQETRRLFDSGEIPLPPGVHYKFAGETKDFQDLLGTVLLAAGLAVGAMYLVLASLYDSFFVPLSIMLVLPLAICGAFYALELTGQGLDIYSMIGCVLLMGVAAKNSILLVDHIQEGMRSGKALREAILSAGRVRLRPIMMTSFALIAGMLPMAFPLEESARQRAPMAIAVIGGVVTSTLLTLIVVPAAYEYILRFQGWALGKASGRDPDPVNPNLKNPGR